jgi:cytochrome P450
MREPSEDVEFHGQTIPAGSTMVCLLAAANRDPRRFDNPDAFDIFRKDLDVAKAFAGGANHMTFALGRHFCVGSILAQYEVHQGTNQLLDAMGDIKFADGRPPEEAGIFVRAPKTMPLTYTPLL